MVQRGWIQKVLRGGIDWIFLNICQSNEEDIAALL